MEQTMDILEEFRSDEAKNQNNGWVGGLVWRGVVAMLCALWASNFAAAKLIMAEPGMKSIKRLTHDHLPFFLALMKNFLVVLIIFFKVSTLRCMRYHAFRSLHLSSHRLLSHPFGAPVSMLRQYVMQPSVVAGWPLVRLFLHRQVVLGIFLLALLN
jgi:hypothetical protein